MNERFNGGMLGLARELRRMSQADVVRALHGRITQGTLSKIEHGLIEPVEALIAALANVLRVLPSFFLRSSYIRSMPVSYHRKRQKLSARDQDSIHAQSEIYRINLKTLLESVDLETRKPPVPAFDLDAHPTVANVASSLRQHWSLPRGPIQDLTQLLEDAGVIVVPFDFGTPLMDGFCQHTGDGLPPVIFINSAQPADRYRYSLAHEMAHLVLHRTPNPEQEIQANRLASEFLMPTAEIRSHFHNLSLQKLMDLKLHWGVSMQALIYRAWELGTISDRGRKYYFMQMSKRGWREKEPIEISTTETASSLRDLVSAHVNDLGYSATELSTVFGLPENEARALYPMAAKRPQLRLVSH